MPKNKKQAEATTQISSGPSDGDEKLKAQEAAFNAALEEMGVRLRVVSKMLEASRAREAELVYENELLESQLMRFTLN